MHQNGRFYVASLSNVNPLAYKLSGLVGAITRHDWDTKKTPHGYVKKVISFKQIPEVE